MIQVKATLTPTLNRIARSACQIRIDADIVNNRNGLGEILLNKNAFEFKLL